VQSTIDYAQQYWMDRAFCSEEKYNKKGKTVNVKTTHAQMELHRLDGDATHTKTPFHINPTMAAAEFYYIHYAHHQRTEYLIARPSPGPK